MRSYLSVLLPSIQTHVLAAAPAGSVSAGHFPAGLGPSCAGSHPPAWHSPETSRLLPPSLSTYCGVTVAREVTLPGEGDTECIQWLSLLFINTKYSHSAQTYKKSSTTACKNADISLKNFSAVWMLPPFLCTLINCSLMWRAHGESNHLHVLSSVTSLVIDEENTGITERVWSITKLSYGFIFCVQLQNPSHCLGLLIILPSKWRTWLNTQ